MQHQSTLHRHQHQAHRSPGNCHRLLPVSSRDASKAGAECCDPSTVFTTWDTPISTPKKKLQTTRAHKKNHPLFSSTSTSTSPSTSSHHKTCFQFIHPKSPPWSDPYRPKHLVENHSALRVLNPPSGQRTDGAEEENLQKNTISAAKVPAKQRNSGIKDEKCPLFLLIINSWHHFFCFQRNQKKIPQRCQALQVLAHHLRPGG